MSEIALKEKFIARLNNPLYSWDSELTTIVNILNDRFSNKFSLIYSNSKASIVFDKEDGNTGVVLEISDKAWLLGFMFIARIFTMDNQGQVYSFDQDFGSKEELENILCNSLAPAIYRRLRKSKKEEVICLR